MKNITGWTISSAWRPPPPEPRSSPRRPRSRPPAHGVGTVSVAALDTPASPRALHYTLARTDSGQNQVLAWGRRCCWSAPPRPWPSPSPRSGPSSSPYRRHRLRDRCRGPRASRSSDELRRRRRPRSRDPRCRLQPVRAFVSTGMSRTWTQFGTGEAWTNTQFYRLTRSPRRWAARPVGGDGNATWSEGILACCAWIGEWSGVNTTTPIKQVDRSDNALGSTLPPRSRSRARFRLLHAVRLLLKRRSPPAWTPERAGPNTWTTASAPRSPPSTSP